MLAYSFNETGIHVGTVRIALIQNRSRFQHVQQKGQVRDSGFHLSYTWFSETRQRVSVIVLNTYVCKHYYTAVHFCKSYCIHVSSAYEYVYGINMVFVLKVKSLCSGG